MITIETPMEEDVQIPELADRIEEEPDEEGPRRWTGANDVL